MNLRKFTFIVVKPRAVSISFVHTHGVSICVSIHQSISTSYKYTYNDEYKIDNNREILKHDQYYRNYIRYIICGMRT